MNSAQQHPRRRLGSERGVILLLACFSMPVLIGMLGLGVDLSVMYSIKAKLQMACDGAAVAALRSLSLAQDTASQTATASTIATQWFKANFAGNYLGATGTTTPTVTVTDLGSVRSVAVAANTHAPTYFMKYWGRPSTLIGATSQSSRRDVVIMLVLDRSGSMTNSNNSYNGLTPCEVMKQASKQFAGMFQPGRDRIGLVTFAETALIAQSPTTAFQTALGYTNSSGSTNGAIDNITCGGWTNTSTALAIAYNELYKTALPGALNMIVLFTDGTPTAGTFNFVTSAATDPTGAAHDVLATTSGCLNGSNVAVRAGGSLTTSPRRSWISREANGASSISLGASSWAPWATIQGPVGALTTSLTGVDLFFSPGATPVEGTKNTAEAPGCGFVSSGSAIPDVAFIPSTDYWGNPTDGYRGTLATIVVANASRAAINGANLNNAVFNIADGAANFARTTRLLPSGTSFPGVQVNTIGLGGNGGVDFTLLQRMANDPAGDTAVPYAAYPSYNQAQPVGQFIYSPDASQLQAAFTKLGSQILRISR